MTAPLSLDPRKTALLVIDMQNDFCHAEGLHGRNAERLGAIGLDPSLLGKVAPVIRRVLDAARAAGALVVHTRIMRHPEADRVDRLHRLLPATFEAYARSGPVPTVTAGSWGAETIDELKPLPDEIILDKKLYSSFYMTDLELTLRRRGIETVVITGTVLHACVLGTAFDAYTRDFDVVMVEDAVSTWDPALRQPALRIVELILGVVRPADEVIAALGKGASK